MASAAPGYQYVSGEGTKIRWRCLSCTRKYPARETIVFKRNRANHERSNLHIESIENSDTPAAVTPAARTTQSATSRTTTPSSQPPLPLSLAARFGPSSSYSGANRGTRLPNPPSSPNEYAEYDHAILDSSGNEVLFTAGPRRFEIDNELRERLSRDLQELDLYDHTTFSWSMDTIEDIGVAIAESQGHTADDSEDEDEPEASNSVEDDERWSPFGSKVMFMIALISSLPRLRLSEDHLKTMLWVFRECGLVGVPTFYKVQQLRAHLAKRLPIGPVHHVSPQGNHFDMIHPKELFALDFANPLVRQLMHFYPEVTNKVSEFYHADKYLKEIPDDELTPMWADFENPHRVSKHFYVRELARLESGVFVIPLRFVRKYGTMHFEGFQVSRSPDGIFVVEDYEKAAYPASELQYNGPDLLIQLGTINFLDCQHVKMLHPIRPVAQNRPVFRLRLMPWADDVSGNKSKQYNAHMNAYAMSVNIPHRYRAQEYYVRYLCASPHASSSEQFTAMAEDCGPDVWHTTYDAVLGCEVMFQIDIHVLPADNPQQCEHASLSSLKANMWCRKGFSGGSEEFRETTEGYDSLIKSECCKPRTAQATLEAIMAQIRTACRGVESAVNDLHTATGVKDKLAAHWIEKLIKLAREQQQERIYNKDTKDKRLKNRKLTGEPRKAVVAELVKAIEDELFDWVVLQTSVAAEPAVSSSSESQAGASADNYMSVDEEKPTIKPGVHYNILLSLRSLDPHKDTPVEILHTILLGNDKYVWHETSKDWKSTQEEEFATRLNSASIDGLSIESLRPHYMVQYKNSLIGKHFKSLEQLGIFQLQDLSLCSNVLFGLWKAAGNLGALLWFPEIDDLDTYMADLEICVENMIDRWIVFDPRRIMVKYKIHVLSHLKDDIRRFGPSVLFSTEIFECYNAVFRLCSVLSNHQAPSRDIGIQMANLERFKHLVSGGYYKSSDNQWVQAGDNVRNFLVQSRDLQRRLGWSSRSLKAEELGAVHLVAKKKRNPSVLDVALQEFLPAVEHTLLSQPDELWEVGKTFTAESKDICRVPGEQADAVTVHPGRIQKILVRRGSPLTSGKAVVALYHIPSNRHERLNMPLLNSSRRNVLINTQDVLFLFNAQHDCYAQGCLIGETSIPVVQERRETLIKTKAVLHSEGDQFIINMHALHNAHLIRQTVHRDLVCPLRYVGSEECVYSTRNALHAAAVTQLQAEGPERRKEREEKRKATLQAKKKKEQGVAENEDVLAIALAKEAAGEGMPAVEPEQIIARNRAVFGQ